MKISFPSHLPAWNPAGMDQLAMVMSLRGLPSESNWKHARARISQSCPNRALFDFRGSSCVSIGSTIHPRKLVGFYFWNNAAGYPQPSSFGPGKSCSWTTHVTWSLAMTRSTCPAGTVISFLLCERCFPAIFPCEWKREIVTITVQKIQ